MHRDALLTGDNQGTGKTGDGLHLWLVDIHATRSWPLQEVIVNTEALEE